MNLELLLAVICRLEMTIQLREQELAAANARLAELEGESNP